MGLLPTATFKKKLGDFIFGHLFLIFHTFLLSYFKDPRLSSYGAIKYRAYKICPVARGPQQNAYSSLLSTTVINAIEIHMPGKSQVLAGKKSLKFHKGWPSS